MTRKDYEAIAAALNDSRPVKHPFPGAETVTDAYRVWHAVVIRLSATLRKDNPRYDEGRFMDAAGAR